MSSNALCGTGGTVTGTDATEVRSWSITLDVQVADATSFDSLGYVERIACLKGASGEFVSVGDPASVGPASATFAVAGSGSGCSIGGDILITKVSIDVKADSADPITYTMSFVFDGKITASL